MALHRLKSLAGIYYTAGAAERGQTYEKGFARPMFTSRTSASRPLSEATEMYDTDFEEDSDLDDYAGRRSEDSVSNG